MQYLYELGMPFSVFNSCYTLQANAQKTELNNGQA